MNDSLSQPSAAAAEKKRLRQALRAARRGLDRDAQAAASHGLLDQLLTLDAFRAARRISLYLANDGEIDTREVIRWCRENDRQPYLPVIQRSGGRNWMLFGALEAGIEFKPNNLGIPEPVLDPDEMLSAEELDLVLVPLVGFDASGNRVGMGGGFYDTTFAFLREMEIPRPLLVGIAHEVQRVERIDAESWDIPLPLVVTNKRVYRFDS